MTPEEEDVVLFELRTHGTVVTVGGSRCHTDYHFGPEGFVATAFDEGHTEDHPCSEAQLRRVMRSDPGAFRGVLKHPHLRALRAAWAAGDRVAARAHLAQVRAVDDGLGEGAVLDAVLGDAAGAPPETLDLIREKVGGQTAWHVYMGLVAGWKRTAEVAAGGLWFTERLVALVGESEGTARLRAQFQAMAAAADASAG